MLFDYGFQYEMAEPKRAHPGTTPIIFLLHDEGSNPRDILDRVYEHVDPILRIISMCAPVACGGDRYSWFGPSIVTPSLDDYIVLLKRLGRSMFDIGMKYSPVISSLYLYAEGKGGTLGLADYLGVSHWRMANQFDGFGAGSAMKYIVVGGHLPEELRLPVDRITVRSRALYLGQGTQDELCSVDEARDSVHWLENAGLKPDYREFEMGHRPSSECIADAMKWIGPIRRVHLTPYRYAKSEREEGGEG